MKSSLTLSILICINLVALLSCDQERNPQGEQITQNTSTSNTPAKFVDELAQSRLSDQRHFEFYIEPETVPLPLNQLHHWVLFLKDKNDQPIDDAEITVVGGMPAHDHGLPTAPAVTPHLGEGRYRREGVQFHMPGQWFVRFDLAAGDLTDTITYRLMVQP